MCVLFLSGIQKFCDEVLVALNHENLFIHYYKLEQMLNHDYTSASVP